MIDVIRYVLSQLGHAHVSVWTWTIADYEVACMQGLMARSEILSGRLIIDASADRRNQAIIEACASSNSEIDRLGCVKNNAKIARIWTDDLHVLARGSFNLNQNPRFEQLDLTVNGPDFDLRGRNRRRLARPAPPMVKRRCRDRHGSEQSLGILAACNVSGEE